MATETTVPRGRVSSAGKLGCSCVVSLPCLPDFCALATAELGAREVVKKAITKSLARTQATAAKKKKVSPPELCWTIAEAVAWSESLARAVTCDLSWARGRARLESLELYLVVVNFKCVFSTQCALGEEGRQEAEGEEGQEGEEAEEEEKEEEEGQEEEVPGASHLGGIAGISSA